MIASQSIWQAKSSYFKHHFTVNSSDPRTFWNTIKTMENKNIPSRLPTVIKYDDVVAQTNPNCLINLTDNLTFC